MLDSGVQAAVTVPASPYLGWLARYQAFYLAALVLFLLFGLVWGLVAPAARTAVVAEHSLRMSPQPSLDVGGPRALTPPPAARDVPWREGEGPSGEHPVPVAPPALAQLLHDQGSLDPVVEAPIDPLLPLAAGAEDQAVKQPAVHKPHAPFAGDLFTPTPGQFAMAAEPEAFISAAAARERGEPEPGDELNLKELPPQQAEQALPAESSAAKGDFSFAGLLDEAHAAPVPVLEQRPPMSHDQPESTVPGQPSLELLARSREEPAMVAYGGLAANTTHDYFPGDEPTRIEPVSAALLDKLREKDPPEPHSSFGSEPAAPAVHNGFDSPGPSGENRQATLIDQAPLSLEAGYESSPEAAEEERDPDQVHWQETFEQFRELKASLGEPSDRITFEKFSAKLRKNREDLLAKHNCIGVRFSVYEKEGRAAIRAKAIRE